MQCWMDQSRELTNTIGQQYLGSNEGTRCQDVLERVDEFSRPLPPPQDALLPLDTTPILDGKIDRRLAASLREAWPPTTL